jgi:hypothetical protein
LRCRGHYVVLLSTPLHSVRKFDIAFKEKKFTRNVHYCTDKGCLRTLKLWPLWSRRSGRRLGNRYRGLRFIDAGGKQTRRWVSARLVRVDRPLRRRSLYTLRATPLTSGAKWKLPSKFRERRVNSQAMACPSASSKRIPKAGSSASFLRGAISPSSPVSTLSGEISRQKCLSSSLQNSLDPDMNSFATAGTRPTTS